VRTDLPRVSLIGHDDEVGGPLKAPTWDDVGLLLTTFASYDLLFLDTPPSVEAQPESFRTLLHRVDLVVVPCTPTFDDAESVAPFVQYLSTESIAALVVLNKVKPRVNNGPIKAYLLEHGADLCAAEVSDRTDFHRTAAQGLAMPDFPGHAGADEIRGVWAVIRQRLGMGSRMRSASRAGGGRRVRA